MSENITETIEETTEATATDETTDATVTTDTPPARRGRGPCATPNTVITPTLIKGEKVDFDHKGEWFVKVPFNNGRGERKTQALRLHVATNGQLIATRTTLPD
jgi:hypothetical protein